MKGYIGFLIAAFVIADARGFVSSWVLSQTACVNEYFL